MDHNARNLLPIGAHALSADPRLAYAVQELGRTYGYNYFDDDMVRRSLAEHETSLRRTSRGGLVWAGALLLLVGIVWLVVAASAKPQDMAVALAPPTAVLLLGIAALVRVYFLARSKLRHPFLDGYRHVLAASLAHGAPVTFVPAWLTGRGDGQLEAAPLPPYSAPVATPIHGAGAATVPPPSKPPAVEEYERIAEQGGWHDEAGGALILAGAIGIGYAVFQDIPAAYAAALLIPLGIWIWLAGHRLGKRQQQLSAEARRYLDDLVRAQAAGAVVPELTPPLRKLLDTRL
ncbi:hypothetical protein GTY65_36510 [Streptomyces sp. SID8379]|uniref:hypothetical protein n=1 Tax=unclassified Streptomyces TaxID=2593676 RepID=UPI00036C82D5|nr:MULTISPECIES: hypothetical protein [unclassified Streptomyces]MYW69530.1 hypothetical protein [Streptomyces sp. SID8379]